MGQQHIYVHDNYGGKVAKYTNYSQYDADFRQHAEDDEISNAIWNEGSWQITSEILHIDGETFFVRILTEIV